MEKLLAPILVRPSEFEDGRGTVFHFGSLQLDCVRRIYFISPKPSAGFRGWHGHKFESKTFRCIAGSFRVSSIRVEDWTGGPSQNKAASWVLSSAGGELLVVPEGYANGLLSLEEDSVLMVLSNRTLEESQMDDYRFPESTFDLEV